MNEIPKVLVNRLTECARNSTVRTGVIEMGLRGWRPRSRGLESTTPTTLGSLVSVATSNPMTTAAIPASTTPAATTHSSGATHTTRTTHSSATATTATTTSS
ncbi:hypothetical protein K7432_009664, partial [Basidiobolus ranarum]